MKDGSEEMEHEFRSFSDIPSGKTRLTFQMFRCPQRFFFCRNDSKTRVPFAFQLYFLEPFENGKQPEP